MPVGGLVPDESTAFQTGPIVVLDVLYFTTYNTTYAIDASTCVLKWKYSHPGPPGGLGVNRGIAFDSGKLFRGTGDAHILALDASTGQPAWDVSIGDPKKGESGAKSKTFSSLHRAAVDALRDPTAGPNAKSWYGRPASPARP